MMRLPILLSVALLLAACGNSEEEAARSASAARAE